MEYGAVNSRWKLMVAVQDAGMHCGCGLEEKRRSIGARSPANARDKQVNAIRIVYKMCRGLSFLLSKYKFHIKISCVRWMEGAEAIWMGFWLMKKIAQSNLKIAWARAMDESHETLSGRRKEKTIERVLSFTALYQNKSIHSDEQRLVPTAVVIVSFFRMKKVCIYTAHVNDANCTRSVLRHFFLPRVIAFLVSSLLCFAFVLYIACTTLNPGRIALSAH